MLALASAFVPLLPAQTTQSEQQFITSTTSSISSFQSSLPQAGSKVILSSNLVFANGGLITQPTITLDLLLKYVDGLKAAGAQRVDINPAVTSINDPIATAAYDAVIAHIRALGMQLALNPQVVGGELGISPTFQDFQTMALVTYPALAARYQPDNFVIVHEPTTMDARLGVLATTTDWNNFIGAVAPLIKAASPHTRLGAGGFYDAPENAFFMDFVTIPVLDFMTIDIYDVQSFAGYNSWIQLAHSAVDATHPNGKGIYIEETWAPKFLPNPLPAGWQALPGGLESVTLVGDCNADFQAMDVAWLQAMLTWASSSGMEAVTPFTTQAFFYYYQGPTAVGTSTYGYDSPLNPVYITSDITAIQAGQLTATGKAYFGFYNQFGMPRVTSVSSASYATLPTVFDPSCAPGNNPCNAETVVAPDELVSAYGADLANVPVLVDGTFPTTLGGTTATLVDSSNTSYPVALYAVTPQQINYYVPAKAASGPATLTVISGDGTSTSGTVQVAQVMPGIYTAYPNGIGAPSAVAIIVHADGSQSSQLTYSSNCSAASGCDPAPINLASTDLLYIELYGTGIRHVSAQSNVTGTFNGQSVAVQYAGPSGYVGEDQINIEIPQGGLFGAGTADLILTVDGQVANTVKLNLNLQ